MLKRGVLGLAALGLSAGLLAGCSDDAGPQSGGLSYSALEGAWVLTSAEGPTWGSLPVADDDKVVLTFGADNQVSMVVELAPVDVEVAQSGQAQSGEAQSGGGAALAGGVWEPFVIFNGTLTDFTEDGFVLDFDGQDGAFQASEDGDRLSMSAGDEHWEFVRDN